MKGLIIKDLMSFRKGLINVIFVSAAVLVFSVMVCISAGSGNLYRMMQENTLKTDEYSLPPMMVLKFFILVLMILPMVSVGDSITYLLREDKRSGFVSVASATDDREESACKVYIADQSVSARRGSKYPDIISYNDNERTDPVQRDAVVCSWSIVSISDIHIPPFCDRHGSGRVRSICADISDASYYSGCDDC